MNKARNKGSLPSYIVNLDELAELVAKAMQERSLEYRGNMGFKGLRYSPSEPSELLWRPDFDIMVTGIKVDYSSKRNMGEDYLGSYTVLIDGEPVVSEYNIKENEDYIRFRQPTLVTLGSRIEIVVNGESPKVEIAFGIEFIFYGKEAPPTKIIIRCIDDRFESGEELYLLREYNLFIKGNATRTISAPDIGGYDLVGDAEQEVEILIIDDVIVVEFIYIPTDKTIIVSHISTTGLVLKQEEVIVTPPTYQEIYAAEIEGYELVDLPTRIVTVSIGVQESIHEIFLYKPKEKHIKILAIEEATGEVILIKRMTIENLPSDVNVAAPILEGYELLGDDSITVGLTSQSPIETEVKFFYFRIGHGDGPTVDHDYDLKVIMRWEDNTPIDMDLRVMLDMEPNTEVHYANRKLKTDEGTMWLDYDYTSHGSGDFVAKPEIVTVLGFERRRVNIFVNKYSSGGRLNRDVDLLIYESIGNKDKLLARFKIDKNQIDYGRRLCHVADVSMLTGRVFEKLEYS